MHRRLCHWFARCLAPAVTTIKHPVLGEVPVCSHCWHHMRHGEFRGESA